jgi:hypothetical protein
MRFAYPLSAGKRIQARNSVQMPMPTKPMPAM